MKKENNIENERILKKEKKLWKNHPLFGILKLPKNPKTRGVNQPQRPTLQRVKILLYAQICVTWKKCFLINQPKNTGS